LVRAFLQILAPGRDGVERAGVVIAGTLLREKIENGEIRLDNLDRALEQLVGDIRELRMKSISHDEQVKLLRKYGEKLLGTK
jgi:hypothetical protein